MRVLVAPDKLKESATAAVFAHALARGVRRVVAGAEVDVCPVADGGDGTVAALLAALGGEQRAARVTGPLGEPIDAAWALLPDGTAVVESASAAGLALVPPARRDPLRTTTRGVGELVRAALDAGALRIVVGVGGTATVDGGAGALQALGLIGPSSRPLCGGDLAGLDGIDPAGLDPRLRTVPVRVACDVTSPLLGADGAAAVYGPQKGATPEQVTALERGLARWAALLGSDPGLPGGGAGGGLAYGLVAAGARIVPGIDWVLDQIGFAARAAHADLVLTGEGRLDGQTSAGKAIAGVARAAKAAGVPCVALCGSVAGDLAALHATGLTAAFSLADGPRTLAESLRDAERLAERAAEQVVRLFATGR